jgi:hypothetical protein
VALLSRRAFLRQVSAAALAVPLALATAGRGSAAPSPLSGVEVRPRSQWAQGLSAPALQQERPGDVRFLLVHHSASPNTYAAADVPGLIRGFHAFHTGPAKGWPDVAYNFFVDRYGGVWEGRTGSLAGPVMPDATGGSQGFAQICCLIGDHTVEPPTPEARRSMTALLAALAERYGVDPTPGTTTTFLSRGSTRWPAGTEVTARTIAGHRDMSLTSCPGDAAYALVAGQFPAAVTAVLAARATPSSTPPSRSAAAVPSSSTAPGSPAATTTAQASRATEDRISPDDVGWMVGGALVTAAATVVGLRRTRTDSGS